jgi:serine protease AprX
MFLRFLNRGSGNSQIAAQSVIETEHFVDNLTMDRTVTSSISNPTAPVASREWERHDASVEFLPRRRRRFEVPVAIGTACAFAFVGIAAFGAAESQMQSATVPAEPAVAAADLPLGAMYHVVDQIGARALWAEGYTGAGVNVAVIDTGIAPVESLSGEGKIVAAVDFSSDAASPETAFTDALGHGTFVSGIIAGQEPGSDPALAAEHPQWFLGVAPDAGIVSVKVDDAVEGVNPVDVISGIDWVVANADALDIGVINLSFSTGSLAPYQGDALAAALERAWDAGIVVVTGAGNDGSAAAGLASPANDPFLIAVAGADVSDDGIAIADWSSSGDGVRNPDITAPGAHINSLRAPGSDADVNHPEGFVDDETFKGSGTSFSAPVIAGVAALLREAHPDWTPDQIKAAIVETAAPLNGFSADLAGSGLVRADMAVGATVDGATQSFDRSTGVFEGAPSAGVSTVWNGNSWVGNSWVGNSWVGNSWVGNSWVGNSWVGNSWVGNSWVGNSWV